jgi:ABC-type proline/glycine betaine transport system ATPase subunit
MHIGKDALEKLDGSTKKIIIAHGRVEMNFDNIIQEPKSDFLNNLMKNSTDNSIKGPKQ